MQNKRGFTLVELLLVIVIVAILAVSAIPKFYDVFSQAENVSRSKVLGAVRSGIAIYRAGEMITSESGIGWYPETLDSATATQCSKTNPCFTTIMTHGIDDPNWAKSNDTTYTYTRGDITVTFTYTPSTGKFE